MTYKSRLVLGCWLMIWETWVTFLASAPNRVITAKFLLSLCLSCLLTDADNSIFFPEHYKTECERGVDIHA